MIDLEQDDIVEPNSIQKILVNGEIREVSQHFLLAFTSSMISNAINFSVQYLTGLNRETKNTIDVTPK